MKLKPPAFFLSVFILCAAVLAEAQSSATINVQVNQLGHRIPPTLWGIFFEDINLSADGGIYPELLRNRSFENSEKPDDWRFANIADGKSEMTIDSSKPLNSFNRRSLRVKADGAFTLENDGYWGANIIK